MLIFLQAIKNDSDRSAVEELYRTYGSTMLYIAQGILKDRYRAEDAVSQSFIKLIDNLQKITFSDCNKTKGLLVIIVRNTCLDMLRSEKGTDVLSPDEMEKETDCSQDLPLEHVISEESYSRMMNCLLKLNDSYKDILRLKYVYDYTNAEIVGILGISEGNARARLYRARQALIREIEKEEVCNDLYRPSQQII